MVVSPGSINVLLDSWIIQDGNYGDFKRGQRRAFALEFWPTSQMTPLHPDADHSPSMELVEGARYRVRGKVVYATLRWWAIDVGLPIYQSNGSIPAANVGSTVKGEVSIGIDPFPYFEQHALEPGAPAMIHDWRIDGIDLDTTPWVERTPGVLERDASKTSWTATNKTKAWTDDGSRASYLLRCSRLSDRPRHKLSTGRNKLTKG